MESERGSNQIANKTVTLKLNPNLNIVLTFVYFEWNEWREEKTCRKNVNCIGLQSVLYRSFENRNSVVRSRYFPISLQIESQTEKR